MNKKINQEINWLLKEKYLGKETKAFFTDVERLKKGEPIDYVIGFTEFLGCKIDLSYKPLIPRPETRFWTQRVIRDINVIVRQVNVLDMFSGSGCVGLAILKNCENAKVTFADTDKNAILQIKKNLKLNKLAHGCSVKSNIFENIKGRFDYILANPPYIPTKNKNKIQKSVLRYEPNQALFGGGDGLLYIKKFLGQAENHLTKNGRIFMEFDGSAGSPQVLPQKKQIEKLLKKSGYSGWQFYKDQHKKWRWVKIALYTDFK